MSNLQSELAKMIRHAEKNVYARGVHSATGVKCLERGCSFESEGNLTMHVRKVHGISKHQYLAKHRLPFDTRMYGKEMGERYSATRKAVVARKKKLNEGA